MEGLFEKILDDDEKIIKVIKPHKGKFFFTNLLSWTLMFGLFVAMAILAILFPEKGYKVNYLGLIWPIASFVVAMLFVILFAGLYYKNVYYAYTNKRVIIRSGIFGVDYKSLDMAMIGAVNVYVSLIDKILRKDTGSISFGSMASPMGGAKGANFYNFSHVKMPYETCKEIKASIDQYKKENKSL